MSRKRKTLPLKEKIEILKEFYKKNSGLTEVELAKK